MVLQWTATIETLPGDMEEVLLFDEAEGEHIGYYYQSSGRFIRYIDGEYLQNVTHWMPLPNTPIG